MDKRIKIVIILFVGAIVLSIGSVLFYYLFGGQILHADNRVETISSAGPTTKELKILVVGDIMLDRNVYKKTLKAGDYNFPFANLNWPEADLRIGNLEGPITANRSIVTPSSLTFTFSPKFLESLKNNFTVLNLGNNHTNNFGQKGLSNTRALLTSSSIYYFGDPNNNLQFIAYQIERKGIKLGFLGYNDLIKLNFSDILSKVKEIKNQVDYLLVFPHWGIEYNTQKASAGQIQEAHQLIDAGADIILGTHPHVIQPIEQYKGKYIFYSLGNFIFDQYFSQNTMQGLTVGIDLQKNNENISPIGYNIYPVLISKDSQPSFTVGDQTKKILTALAKVSTGAELKAQIIKGSW